MNLADNLARDLMAGKTVFVTGGGSGINLEIAKSFATLGANIGICGRTLEKLERAAQDLRELGAEVGPVVADVRDLDAMSAAFERSEEMLGPVDTVIAGAAGNFFAPADALSANGFRTVVEIDLQGSFNTARAAFPQLKRTHGSLVFISANQSTMPLLMQAHVCAAKAGIDGLMRALALEWGRHGIRCNSIVPGPIADTEGIRRLDEQLGHDTSTSTTVLGRYGTKEEIGAIAVVLASPLAAYMTGTRVEVDGGAGLIGPGMLNAALGQSLQRER